ncbi:hypothetical protein [Streptomyces sp. IBSBF 2806]|uniref:hypothetical protein n=1 Tax=Streptomyces sp. IBSBF 2806 TaxID=2903529 RepID=UPI002FDBA8E5
MNLKQAWKYPFVALALTASLWVSMGAVAGGPVQHATVQADTGWGSAPRNLAQAPGDTGWG